MSNPLDFSIIANNDKTILCTFTNKAGSRYDLTGVTVLWGLFLNGVEIISKASADSAEITIRDQTSLETRGQVYLFIKDTDTINLETEAYYTHEFNFTDAEGKSVNPSKGDSLLSAGLMYLRRQHKAQP